MFCFGIKKKILSVRLDWNPIFQAHNYPVRTCGALAGRPLCLTPFRGEAGLGVNSVLAAIFFLIWNVFPEGGSVTGAEPHSLPSQVVFL